VIDEEEHLKFIKTYFSSGYQLLQSMNQFDELYLNIKGKFKAWLEEWNEKGSGYVLDELQGIELGITKNKDMVGSSYFELPFKSNCIVNIQNEDDYCFIWSILAHLYPAKKNRNQVSKYYPYVNELNMEKLESPIGGDLQYNRFERQNPDICINVYSLEDENDLKSLCPLFVSQFRDREYKINLLLVEQNGNTHYCLITKLASIFSTDHNKRFICERCLCNSFTSQTALDNHIINCVENKAARIILPEKGEHILEFKNYHYMHKLPFVIYADSEAESKKIDTCQPNPNRSYHNKIIKQKPISFGYYFKSLYPDIIPSH
jgi:hypothetical protein